MMNTLKKIVASAPGKHKRLRKKIIQSGLFLTEWYKKTYPDVVAAGMDPLDHYIKYGDRAGRLPNPFFNPQQYRSIAPGARRADTLALIHYADRGWKNGRNPSARFSLKLYKEQHADACPIDSDPLAYHLGQGQYLKKLVFDVSLERANGAALVAAMILINASGLFQTDWYRNYYPDVAHADIDLLHHFVRHGWRENRKPNIIFDTKWYKDTYAADIDNENPLVFYIREGAQRGHEPAHDFDSADHIAAHPEITSSGINPLAHYLQNGGSQAQKHKKTEQASGTKIKNSTLPVPPHLRGLLQFAPVDVAQPKDSFDPATLIIHWIVPDFAAGGGGHMTIFRMVHFLEVMGHRQTIWINNPSLHKTPEKAYETIVKHFQHFAGNVRFVDDTFPSISGDAVIATDCWTVAPALSVANVLRRFYFVQDFEPSFHAMGANYLVAEETYKQDLDCLCAGPWLSQLMQEKYDRWARHFWLAADTCVYYAETAKLTNKTPRIAVYARHFTERRAVELAFLALEKLAQDGHIFAVDFFGAPLAFSSAPFEFIDHGIASANTLAAIFRNADIGLVFSATNYSLVPQEMMATGLPIVELDGKSTRAIFPDNTVTLALPHPAAIAEAVASLLRSPEKRQQQAEAATAWVRQFSWTASADLVANALIERLSEFATPQFSKSSDAETIKASVVIPTFNAGPGFADVLDAVVRQNAPWPFEILVIDSGSTDSTLDIVRRHPHVKLHQINSHDFSHGGTRNLGIEMTTGAYVAFLTHDAMPFNDRWLHNIVSALEHYPNAAGAFGKHLAYDNASPFTKRDLTAHFDNFNNHPLCLSRKTDVQLYDEKNIAWRQLLHFYSDNNSCLRRSVWEKIPYRAVTFGEDQLWADDIIKAGHAKVYAPQAIVFHSHDYNTTETYERSKTESAFFKHFFDYTLIGGDTELTATINNSNKEDEAWARNNGISDEELSIRKALNEARLKGYLAGTTCDTSDMF